MLKDNFRRRLKVVVGLQSFVLSDSGTEFHEDKNCHPKHHTYTDHNIYTPEFRKLTDVGRTLRLGTVPWEAFSEIQLQMTEMRHDTRIADNSYQLYMDAVVYTWTGTCHVHCPNTSPAAIKRCQGFS